MRQSTRQRPRAVPIFSLYGEQDVLPSADKPVEFVHIEHIATRSQRYDWEIASHAHQGLMQLVCVFDGGAHVQLDDASLQMRAPAAVVIPSGAVHAFQFQAGTQGYVLTVAESLLRGGDAAQHTLFEPLRSQPHLLDLRPVADVAQRVAALLEQLWLEFREARSGRDQMFECLVRAVLLLLARRLSATPLSLGARGRVELFARFRTLVEAHFTAHWTVPRYAKALNLTESRLNRLCLALSQKSAFDLVQERLLLEAKRKLCYVAAPVSQLAYELGFTDPAYFCRYFKKHTGLAPSAYRVQRDPARRAPTSTE